MAGLLLTCVLLALPLSSISFLLKTCRCERLLSSTNTHHTMVFNLDNSRAPQHPANQNNPSLNSAGTQGKCIRIRLVGASSCLVWDIKLCFRSSVRIWWAVFTKACAKDPNLSSNTRFQSRDKGSAMVVHDWFKTFHKIFALVDRHTWASHSFQVDAAPYRCGGLTSVKRNNQCFLLHYNWYAQGFTVTSFCLHDVLYF